MQTEAQKRPKIEARGTPFSSFFDFFIFFSALQGGEKPRIGDFCDFRAHFFARKFAMRKKAEKKRTGAQTGAMRGAGGRGRRVALACITLRVFAGVGAGVCMQDFVRHSARRWGAAD